MSIELTLPHWESTPEDLPAAIREIKRAITEQMRANGTTPQQAFDTLAAEIAKDVAEIKDELARGEQPWPVVEYADVAAGTVSDELRAKIRKRGCAVVRGTFERETAEQWDRDIVEYTESNEFFENYRGMADTFFETVDSKPEIYPLYWSHAQMEARQSPRMATVQAFLNSFWDNESQGRTWFDPDRDTLYPDRMRRRPPGTTSPGLKPHLDPGSLDLWMVEGYQKNYRHLFSGDVLSYDPWDPAFRTEAPQYGQRICSVFRTFQGWTALSDMRHDQGVLHVVPIAKAMGYLMLRPLLDDVPADSMCDVQLERTFPVSEQWHPLLLEALVPIPDVAPGDTVWWHCDMIHAVAPVEDQQGWGNVMYIPAAPWCAKNEAYTAKAFDAFDKGLSAPDFPPEHYEADWTNRFRADELNEFGRRGFGLDD